MHHHQHPIPIFPAANSKPTTTPTMGQNEYEYNYWRAITGNTCMKKEEALLFQPLPPPPGLLLMHFVRTALWVTDEEVAAVESRK
jgi:hypothetical protein